MAQSTKEFLNPKTLMQPTGYTHIAKASGGTTVYLSGQVAADASGKLIGEGNLEAQAEQVFKNLKAGVEAAGGTMADVTFNHIFITDWANYGAVNAVYARFFPGDKPARYCVQCGLVKPEALVEIASVAHLGR